MKRTLFIFLLPLIGLMGFGQNAQSTVDIDRFVEMMKSIEGYVFIGKGETRDLSRTFGRTDSVFTDMASSEISQYDWSVLNENILYADDYGKLEGLDFGETVVTVSGKGAEHNFVVFVCPIVKIASPEGAIYTYHKIYNQKAKIYFTQSHKYLINCVMLNGVDVTDRVKADESGDGDGYFESIGPIVGDLNFVLSMESRKASDGSAVVASSGIRLRTVGNNVTFVDLDGSHALASKNVTVLDATREKEIYSGRLSADNTISIDKSGVYFVKIDGFDGDFKIIIE